MSQVNGFGKVDARLGGYPNPEKRLLDSYLLSCDVPEAARHRIPVSVSLLTTECPGDEAASNNLVKLWNLLDLKSAKSVTAAKMLANKHFKAT